jgi:membrane protease YdiL (CAAX protease family)
MEVSSTFPLDRDTARERGDVAACDNARFMSQERSKPSVLVAILLLAIAAYGAGILAMGLTQARLIQRLELRFVLILSEMALALPALIAGLLLAKRIPELYRFQPLSMMSVIKTFVLGTALWGLSLGVFELQYVFVRPPLAYLEQFQGLHEMLKPHGVSGWIFSVAAIAVAPAVCEEILFRGLLTPALRRVAGSAVAIVFSAALFAAIHIDGMPDGTSVYYRVPFAFVLGMLLAKIRLDTWSLWPPIIAHATLNATTFVVVLLVEEPKGVLPDPQPMVALAMLGVGSAAAAYLMRQIRVVAAPTA